MLFNSAVVNSREGSTYSMRSNKTTQYRRRYMLQTAASPPQSDANQSIIKGRKQVGLKMSFLDLTIYITELNVNQPTRTVEDVFQMTCSASVVLSMIVKLVCSYDVFLQLSQLDAAKLPYMRAFGSMRMCYAVC